VPFHSRGGYPQTATTAPCDKSSTGAIAGKSAAAVLARAGPIPYDPLMWPRPTDLQPTAATRRLFLRGVGVALAGAAVAPARLLAGPREERLLSFFHTHTHERLTVPYFADGAYLPEGLTTLNSFLRDFRTGDEHPIDPALFDILNDLRLATGTRTPFQVISGYRSPQTNAMLREHSHGVAQGSLHLQGRAIDVRLADVGSDALRDAAVELQRGGVGYYRGPDFVHVDTGRVRRW
jgi:uncharacterized protein YcbK (DUF882 family)